MDAVAAGAVAVIFVSRRTNADAEGYAAAAGAMDRMAAAMPGYLGIDAVRDAAGHGITVSYWRDRAAAAAWRDDAEHGRIRDLGRARWYASYAVFVTTVERAYRWTAADGPGGESQKKGPPVRAARKVLGEDA